MKQTKKIGKVFALAVLTILALFYTLPNVTHIEQSLEIPATSDQVFELINCPANWTEWYSPLRDKDGVQIIFSGPKEGKNAGMKWANYNPKKRGGEMSIRNSRNNRNITVDIGLDRHPATVVQFRIRPEKNGTSLLTITSRLQFTQDSLLHYLRMMFDRSEELDIIEYLENMSDAASNAIGIPVSLQFVDSFSYISILDSCAWKDVATRMNGLHNELLAFVAKTGLDMINSPIAVYHKLSENKVVYEIGMPFNGKAPEGNNRILVKEMSAGNNVVASYYGSYDTLEDGHNAVQQWIEKHRRQIVGSPWEMYVTDSSKEPDPNKWLTRIFYPVN